jgi:hypothetical protein
MSPVRLLAAALLCSSLAFAQTLPSNSQPFSNRPDAKSAEPWRIAPPAGVASQDPLSRMESGYTSKLRSGSNLRVPPNSTLDNINISLDGTGDDSTCYAIRSYVVARDSKDSDSTHPVSYSTCQPASRYRVRTTVEHGSAARP